MKKRLREGNRATGGKNAIEAADRGETMFYVYAVARPRPPHSALPTGSDRAVTHHLRYRDLVAIVRRVPAAQWRAETLDAHLQDPAWVSATALAHHELLAGLLGHYTLIPFKFCTLYRNKRSLMDMLARHYAQFQNALTRLDGSEEWGVKVYCDQEALAEDVRRSSASIEVLRGRAVGASPGSAYLLERRLQRAVGREAEDRIAACVRETHGRLADQAREAVSNALFTPDVHGRGARMILNAAYLVEGDRRPAFRQALAQLKQSYPESVFTYELSGPWPPYNFAGGPAEGASRDVIGSHR